MYDDYVSLLMQLVGNLLTIVWSSHESHHIHFFFTFFMAYIAAALEGKNGEELLYSVSFASSHIMCRVAPTTPLHELCFGNSTRTKIYHLILFQCLFFSLKEIIY